MNLEIFEKSNRTRIGMIKTYDFVQYEDEFNGEGSFEIQMPTTEESLMYLTFGNFILFDDGVVGIIKYKNDTEDDGTRITIKGKLTNNILSFRSFLLTASYYGTLSENSRQMVSDLMINNENEERNIYFVKLSTDEKYIPSSDKVRVQNTGDKLSKVISEMFLPYGFGYEMYPVIKDYDEETGQYSNLSEIEFRVLKPTDRTINNPGGNTPVVFSFELNNLKNMQYEEDGMEYNTVAIVASEGVGKERKIIEVGETEKTGYDRIELYVDARDIQSEDSEGNAILTNEELEELMKQRGVEKLEEHKKFISFDGSIVEGNMKYTYKKDFYKGDYVSVIDKNNGNIFNLQIISVTKSVSNGVEYFDITFGYDRLKVKKINK